MSIGKTLLVAAVAAPLTAALPQVAAAQDDCSPSRLLMVLDKSSSMLNPIGDETKWDIAVDALGQVAGAYEENIQLGLTVFPGPGGECNAGGLEVAPDFRTRNAIISALGAPPPTGGNYTPMAQTLDAVLEEASLNEADIPAYVVLITDGWQWCYPYDASTRFDPVDSVERLSAAGITTYVVGFGDGVDALALNQMAVMAGTERAACDPTGETPTAADPCYYQADDPGDLVAALMDIASKIPADEVCDGLDNDCDGQIDEDVTMACDSTCGAGTATCSNGAWSSCSAPEPELEICDGVDNDCDGSADEVEGDPLCGPDDTCLDGVCTPLDPEDAGPGTVAAGCGCQADGSDPRSALATAMPLLFALGFILSRRRRRS